MIWGDRIQSTQDVTQIHFDETAKWADVILIHTNGQYDRIEGTLNYIYEKSGKPIIQADGALSVSKPTMPNPYGPKFKTHEERGEAFREFANDLFSLPFIVGNHWCGYIDRLEVVQPGAQAGGIKDEFGYPHTGITDVFAEVNGGIYDFILDMKK